MVGGSNSWTTRARDAESAALASSSSGRRDLTRGHSCTRFHNPGGVRYTDSSAGVGRVIAAADVTAGEESPDSEGSVLANRQRG